MFSSSGAEGLGPEDKTVRLEMGFMGDVSMRDLKRG